MDVIESLQIQSMVTTDAELSTYHPNMKSSARLAASLSDSVSEYGSNQREISVMPITP